MGDFDDYGMADPEGDDASAASSPPAEPSDAEVYAQVLQDIDKAQAALNPVADPQSTGQAPVITGGVLDPRTFPSYPGGGAPQTAMYLSSGPDDATRAEVE